jgi:DNA-binding MarR family transcriptional regulator
MAKPDPNSNPTRQLTHVARLLTRHFDRRIAPLGINVANLAVLGALKTVGSMSQKELTEIGQIGQPAMAQMLARLLRDGLLIKATDTVDRRKVLFALSPRAKEVMAEVETQLRDANAEVFSIFTFEEFQTLMLLTQRLEQSLSSGIPTKPL